MGEQRCGGHYLGSEEDRAETVQEVGRLRRLQAGPEAVETAGQGGSTSD